MTAVVGVFDDRACAEAAERLLDDAGLGERTSAAHPPAGAPPRLARRGERMLRAAIKWCVLGSLVVEIPTLIALLLVPLDINVKVLLGATLWKFGAGFGAWLGAMSAGEQGLDDERAAEYEGLLAEGYSLVAVDVRPRRRPGVRGALLESGALSLRDLRGTIALKPPAAPRPIAYNPSSSR